MAVRRPKKTAQESRLFDRELSWLEWNARVLEMAGDERVPLLERLRFTAIFSSNLDEFCMVRVAELLEAVRTSPNRPRTAGDLLPSEVLDRVGTRMRDLVERQSAMLGELLTELRAAGIAIMPVSEVMALGAGRARGHVPRQHLPRADAACRRPRAAVPVHLESLALARRDAARPRDGPAAPRAREGAGGAAALPARSATTAIAS